MSDKIKHLESLLKEVDKMTFSKSNIRVITDLINNEIIREYKDANKDGHYLFTLQDILEKELDDLNNSRKNPENRKKEFKEVKDCFYFAINGAIVLEKLSN